MISLCARLFDPLGQLTANEGPGQELASGTRRVTRTATLDGGAAIVDGGFADADRTLQVAIQNVSQAQADAAARLVRYHPYISVSVRDGCYLGVPETHGVQGNTLRMQILIVSRLSA